jgi:hypothetical protein
VVLTVASQVSRSRPRARILATDGDYRQKRKAKKLTTFVDGSVSTRPASTRRRKKPS